MNRLHQSKSELAEQTQVEEAASQAATAELPNGWETAVLGTVHAAGEGVSSTVRSGTMMLEVLSSSPTNVLTQDCDPEVIEEFEQTTQKVLDTLEQAKEASIVVQSSQELPVSVIQAKLDQISAAFAAVGQYQQRMERIVAANPLDEGSVATVHDVFETVAADLNKFRGPVVSAYQYRQLKPLPAEETLTEEEVCRAQAEKAEELLARFDQVWTRYSVNAGEENYEQFQLKSAELVAAVLTAERPAALPGKDSTQSECLSRKLSSLAESRAEIDSLHTELNRLLGGYDTAATAEVRLAMSGTMQDVYERLNTAEGATAREHRDRQEKINEVLHPEGRSSKDWFLGDTEAVKTSRLLAEQILDLGEALESLRQSGGEYSDQQNVRQLTSKIASSVEKIDISLQGDLKKLDSLQQLNLETEDTVEANYLLQARDYCIASYLAQCSSLAYPLVKDTGVKRDIATVTEQFEEDLLESPPESHERIYKQLRRLADGDMRGSSGPLTALKRMADTLGTPFTQEDNASYHTALASDYREGQKLLENADLRVARTYHLARASVARFRSWLGELL